MSLTQNPLVANLLLGPTDRTAANPAISFGGSAENNSGTGIYGSFGQVNLAASGTAVLSVSTTAVTMQNDVCILQGAGAPVDGTTGDDVAGKGSLYIDRTNGKLYINNGVISNPTWVLVGSQT